MTCIRCGVSNLDDEVTETVVFGTFPREVVAQRFEEVDPVGSELVTLCDGCHAYMTTDAALDELEPADSEGDE